jgi:hypothetical protein
LEQGFLIICGVNAFDFGAQKKKGGGGAATLRSAQYRKQKNLIQKSTQADQDILDITTILIFSGILDQ